MRTFTNVKDLGDLKAAIAEAMEVKKNRFGYKKLGENKTAAGVLQFEPQNTTQHTEGCHEPWHEHDGA